jgi:hypothetical protein
MHFAAVVLLLFVLPAVSVLAEKLVFHSAADWMALIGRWFVFWPVGVRQFLAGAMQVVRPDFTSERIFQIKDPAALGIVREVGFGNLAMGTIGLASLWIPGWVVPAAVAGGLYYGLAGVGHAARGGGNFLEHTAMISDIWIFALLAAFVGWTIL